jgi:hypothetical protein
VAHPRSVACLSLTGGGALARYTTEILSGLQRLRDTSFPKDDPGRSIAEAFDVLAGTSAGALVAGGLALGRSPDDLSQALEDHGQRIFAPSRSRPWRWLVTAKYAAGPFRDAVDDVLQGDTRTLGEFGHLLAFTAIDETRGVPVTLTGADPEYAHVPLRDAVLASAAAPTYFPAHRVEALDGRRFVDGGLYANAPDVAALTLALKRWPTVDLRNIHVTSIGTTYGSAASPHGQAHPGAQGIFAWAMRPKGRILKLAMRGSTDHAIDLMRALPLADFIRLDAKLEGFDLDSAGDEAFRILRETGQETLRGLTVQQSDALKDMVRRRRAG